MADAVLTYFKGDEGHSLFGAAGGGNRGTVVILEPHPGFLPEVQ